MAKKPGYRNRKERDESISLDELRRLLKYDPDTGILTWLVKRKGRPYGYIPPGTQAGCVWADGYRHITIDYRGYYASHLAFFFMTGHWPTLYVDHKNGNRDDNRWSNLREATAAQNQMNKVCSSRNKLGVKGVCWDRYNYKAYIEIDGRCKSLGHYDSVEEASAAYAAAAKRYFGEYARTE